MRKLDLQALREAQREHLRFLLLESINGLFGESNENVLCTVARKHGYMVSKDYVRTELSWLEEQGYVRLRTVDGVVVCRLTDRGSDVACGYVTVPGVATKALGEPPATSGEGKPGN